MGVVSYKGSKDSNIVFPGEDIGELEWFNGESYVFKDHNPNVPEDERYKLIIRGRPIRKPETGGWWVFASRDGIKWKPLVNRPIIHDNDTQDVIFWDDRIRRYVAYFRIWAPMRKVGRIEFDDIKTGEFKAEGKRSKKYEVVFGSDERDPSNVDFYNPVVVKYEDAEDVYLMFPSAYYHYPEPPEGDYPNDGVLDIRFAVSRDGIKWTRLDRGPYIGLNPEGTWGSKQLYIGVGLVKSPNEHEIWMYYAAYDVTHQWPLKYGRLEGVITRARIRLDGFVAVQSDYTGGEFMTPPLRFEGRHLHLNVDTSAIGEIKVGILNERGTPIKGYSVNDCDKINGNYIDVVVSWRGKKDLSVLTGKIVRLHFVMRDAKLYSFQFKW